MNTEYQKRQISKGSVRRFVLLRSVSIILIVLGSLAAAVAAIALYIFLIIILYGGEFSPRAYAFITVAAFFPSVYGIMILLCGIFGINEKRMPLCRILSCVLVAVNTMGFIWYCAAIAAWGGGNGVLVAAFIYIAFSTAEGLYFFAVQKKLMKERANA